MLSKIYFIASLSLVLVLGFKDLQSKLFLKAPEIEFTIRESPKHYDLLEYLGALHRIIVFSNKHKNEMDINVYFGLFLVNVNLKRALRETQRALPQKLKAYVKEIIWNTEKLLDIFKKAIKNNNNLRNNKYKATLSLFANTTSWVHRLPNFLPFRLNTTVQYLEKHNWKWIIYSKNVDDRHAWVPNPYQSDVCLSLLASADESQIGTSRRCKVLKPCCKMVENGTDFGYALTHRLLFLQQAGIGRGCSIFSEQEDRQMRERFCSAAYQEAQYIAMHDFEMVDLLLEQVCLCALEGYVEFLKRSWLTKVLRFQTFNGCFSLCPQPAVCSASQSGQEGADSSCNGHTTAVAACSLAMAARFILQFY